MLTNLSPFVFSSWLVIVVDSMAGLHFSGQFNKVLLKGSYAEFNGWPMAEISELQFYFKTDVAKPALLLYQDTGGKDGYLEISFLSNGNVRLQLAGSKCSFVQKSIEKNFTEDTWHKLSISRRRAELRFSVDNVSAPIIRCLELPRLSGQNGKAKRSLFIGGIPFQNSRGDSIFQELSQAGLPGRMLTEENRWDDKCNRNGDFPINFTPTTIQKPKQSTHKIEWLSEKLRWSILIHLDDHASGFLPH